MIRKVLVAKLLEKKKLSSDTYMHIYSVVFEDSPFTEVIKSTKPIVDGDLVRLEDDRVVEILPEIEEREEKTDMLKAGILGLFGLLKKFQL